MGLPKSAIFDRKHSWSMSGRELKKLLTEHGIQFEVVAESAY
jgi:hypothetical protein